MEKELIEVVGRHHKELHEANKDYEQGYDDGYSGKTIDPRSQSFDYNQGYAAGNKKLAFEIINPQE